MLGLSVVCIQVLRWHQKNYGNLPEPEAPEELKTRLERLVDDGDWDRVRQQKQEQRA